MKKRVLSAFLALAMVLAMLPATALAAGAGQFTDVSPDDWYYADVSYVTENGYFKGTSDTTFEPYGIVSRAMFITVLARYAKVDVDDSRSVFQDVPVNEWYTGAVTWAKENGIIEDNGAGYFQPGGALSRQEMAVILDRFVSYYEVANSVKHQSVGTAVDYLDNEEIDSQAAEAIRNCQIYGLLQGGSDGLFHPDASSSRAQMAAVIHRLTWDGTARTADNVQNNRCYINGDEVRAFKTDSGVYVVVDDLTGYGFSVVKAGTQVNIDWAGTGYKFDGDYMPDTDDNSMPYGKLSERATRGTVAGEAVDLYTISGLCVVKAEDLGKLGFCEYDAAKEITNIYITAAGYSQNADGYRNVTVDAGNVIGEVYRQNGGHFDPGAPGTESNDGYKSTGIVSMRTHDIDTPRPGSRGIIYSLVPGYFKNYSGLNFIPIFMEELTAAAEAAGKLNGAGTIHDDLDWAGWVAIARSGNLHANQPGSDPVRNAEIEKILEADAYLYAMQKLQETMETCRKNLENIDVTDDSLYDFEGFDEIMDNCLSLGATVYFRFGSAGEDIIDNKFPEYGTEEWNTYRDNLGKIAVKILDHYMNGKYEGAVTHFEIWNEPDLNDFWPNTPEHYYEMYEIVSKAVKAAYPDLPVGGPTITTENDDKGIMESFLEYVIAHDCPLDFYSYHFYPSNNIDAYDYSRLAYMYQDLLAEYGFDIPIILSEYGPALYSQFTGFLYQGNNAVLHLLNNCIYLQDSPAVANYAFANLGSSNGPFGAQSVAFTAMSMLYDTPERLEMTGGDKNGFATIAGKGDDSIAMIISNYEMPTNQMLRNYGAENPNPMMNGNNFTVPGIASWTLPVARVMTYKNNAGYNLTVNNVPYTGEVTIERYRIDADHQLDLVETFQATVSADGTIELSCELPTYCADVLVIHAN